MKRYVLILVAVAMLLTAPGAGAGSERPKPLYASARGETVRATLGSYCIADRSPALCADAAYPLPVHGHIRVSPPRLVVFRMHDMAIKRLTARLLRVEGDEISSLERIEVQRAYSHAARWRAQMPRRLHGANRIDIFVRYRDGIGDANFWVKIAER